MRVVTATDVTSPSLTCAEPPAERAVGVLSATRHPGDDQSGAAHRFASFLPCSSASGSVGVRAGTDFIVEVRMILASDAAATETNIAFFTGGTPLQIVVQQTFRSHEHAGLEELVRQFV